jgi:hypothetical protein
MISVKKKRADVRTFGFGPGNEKLVRNIEFGPEMRDGLLRSIISIS